MRIQRPWLRAAAAAAACALVAATATVALASVPGHSPAAAAARQGTPTLYVKSDSESVPGGTWGLGTGCNAGDSATGGGFNDETTHLVVEQSQPIGNPPTGWEVRVDNTRTGKQTFTLYVDCIHY